ncbi:ATP-binding protein [Verrucomicrobiales bacterium BCK34]|nr:ATP-binding protein [Verrucomicrobiales bacterium BCK34]
MARPAWAEEIRRLYLSSATNQFVLHGNVNDRLLIEDADGSQASVGNLIDYLKDVQLSRFDIVLSYELGGGLRLERGEELFRKLRFTEELPSDPANAIGCIDQFLRFLVNLSRITPDESSDSFAGRNYHVGIVIKSAELIFPVSKQTRDYQLNSMASVVRAWSQETHFLDQNLAVILVTENLNDLNHLLAHNQRCSRIEIPMPGHDELDAVFCHFEETYPKALENFKRRPEFPASRLAGATISSIESLLKRREYEEQPLEEDDLSDLKKSLVERDAQGLIEFLEPTRSLDDVYGHEAVKKWMRQDISLWRQGDLEAMPMGYLLCGPVGTGKTYLVECLAGEAGVPVVKLKNFRDRWVGSTEGNLEKIFGLLHALGRCIVFIDEADQALGSRDSGSGDSGVSGRVYSMMAKEMSNTDNRGRILWILASSRPDLIEVDLKRPGRVDVKIPLFPAHSPEDGYRFIRALGKKHQLNLPKECPGDVLPLVPSLVTPGAAESIAMKIYRRVKTEGVEAVVGLRDCLDEYQNPIPVEIMDFQIEIAVREASDLDFVPDQFRLKK